MIVTGQNELIMDLYRMIDESGKQKEENNGE